uniref:Gag protein n=1 Tax=Heterorhabditis bacteriophora TaxID=37862 RepID=A0A1I7XLL0_HETBA
MAQQRGKMKQFKATNTPSTINLMPSMGSQAVTKECRQSKGLRGLPYTNALTALNS